jgi:hypothetical protein
MSEKKGQFKDECHLSDTGKSNPGVTHKPSILSAGTRVPHVL